MLPAPEQRPHRVRILRRHLPEEDALTERQAEVLRLVAMGLTYDEVGEQLGISERTVRYQMTKIMDRLHLYNRAQVLAYAGKLGSGNKNTLRLLVPRKNDTCAPESAPRHCR